MRLVGTPPAGCRPTLKKHTVGQRPRADDCFFYIIVIYIIIIVVLGAQVLYGVVP